MLDRENSTKMGQSEIKAKGGFDINFWRKCHTKMVILSKADLKKECFDFTTEM